MPARPSPPVRTRRPRRPGAGSARPAALRLRRPGPAAHDARAPRAARADCRRSDACWRRSAGRSAIGRSPASASTRRRPGGRVGRRAPLATRTRDSSSSTSTPAAWRACARRIASRRSAAADARRAPEPERRRVVRPRDGDRGAVAARGARRLPSRARPRARPRHRPHQPRPPAARATATWSAPRRTTARPLRYEPDCALAWYNLGVVLEDAGASRRGAPLLRGRRARRRHRSPTRTAT